MPFDQSRIIEAYSPLGKAFEKQIKTAEDQVRKRVEALKLLEPITQKVTIKDVILENTLTKEAKWT